MRILICVEPVSVSGFCQPTTPDANAELHFATANLLCPELHTSAIWEMRCRSNFPSYSNFRCAVVVDVFAMELYHYEQRQHTSLGGS